MVEGVKLKENKGMVGGIWKTEDKKIEKIKN